MIEELDVYLKTPEYFVHLWWSDNPPANPDTATAVIGIQLHYHNGKEYDGGELDIQNTDFSLLRHTNECLSLINIQNKYEEISEDEYYENIKD